MSVKIPTLIVAFLTLRLSSVVTGIAIGGPFKCGELECPNGSICEITQKPNDYGKSVTIHTLCKTAAGQLLQEDTITKELPEGTFPVISIIQKTVSGRAYGAYSKDVATPEDPVYYTDGTYSEGDPSVHFVALSDGEAKSPKSELIDSQPFQFLPFDFEPAMETCFDKMWSIPRGFLLSTTSFFNDAFGNLFSRVRKLNEFLA